MPASCSSIKRGRRFHLPDGKRTTLDGRRLPTNRFVTIDYAAGLLPPG
jgi:hypothetical protein